MTPASAPPDDRSVVLAVTWAHAIAVGAGAVIVPLAGLAAGYDAPTIGILVAIAAGTQFGIRLIVPWLLGRFEDRSLMTIACTAMTAAFALLIVSTALPVFVLAQVLQGAARGIFWTSSQTHIVRGPGSAVRGLVDQGVASNVGTLIGPVLSGSLAAIDLHLGLAAAGIGAALAAILTRRLHRLPPFDRRRSAGTIALIGRRGIDLACWGAAVSGAWWAMVGSFIPVLLVGAGIGPVGLGILVTASEGAGMLTLLAARGIARRHVTAAVVATSFVVCGVLAALAIVPAGLVASGLLLLIGGSASATVTTLVSAVASLAASPDEQGDALGLSGTFRAAALFAAPAAVSALVAGLMLGPALVVLAAGMSVPGALLGLRRRLGRPDATTDGAGATSP